MKLDVRLMGWPQVVGIELQVAVHADIAPNGVVHERNGRPRRRQGIVDGRNQRGPVFGSANDVVRIEVRQQARHEGLQIFNRRIGGQVEDLAANHLEGLNA